MPSYLGYTISLLVIGLIWANHHAMFDHIEVADRMLLFLNTLLLLLVALIPFTAGVLASALRTGESERTAVVLYGAVLGAILPVLGIITFALLIPFYWLPPLVSAFRLRAGQDSRQ